MNLSLARAEGPPRNKVHSGGKREPLATVAQFFFSILSVAPGQPKKKSIFHPQRSQHPRGRARDPPAHRRAPPASAARASPAGSCAPLGRARMGGARPPGEGPARRRAATPGAAQTMPRGAHVPRARRAGAPRGARSGQQRCARARPPARPRPQSRAPAQYWRRLVALFPLHAHGTQD